MFWVPGLYDLRLFMLKQLLNTKVISLLIAGFLLLRGMIQFEGNLSVFFGLLLILVLGLCLIWFPQWIQMQIVSRLVKTTATDTQSTPIMLFGWFFLLAMLGVCVAFVPDQAPDLLEESPIHSPMPSPIKNP